MPKVQTLREAYGLCRAFGESHGEELARSSARISRARAPHIKIDQNRRLHEAGKLRNVKTGGPVFGIESIGFSSSVCFHKDLDACAVLILTGGHLDRRKAKRFGLQGSADRAADDLLANASQRKAQMGKLHIDIDRAVAVLDLRQLQV